MGISDFYFTERQTPGIDEMLFLTVPQLASSAGGGYRLLGSIVERRSDGPFRQFPVPELLGAPGQVLDALVARRKPLGLEGVELTPMRELAATNRSFSVEKRHLADLKLDSLPMVPAELSVGIDYGRMKSMALHFGEGTYVRYIPKGYLTALYAHAKGDADQVDPLGLLDKHFVVQGVLMARRFSLTFSSSDDFDGGFKAAIAAKNAAADGARAGLELKYQVDNERELSAKVVSDEEYLVAVRAVRWRGFDLS
jgi:hypothetical protein